MVWSFPFANQVIIQKVLDSDVKPIAKSFQFHKIILEMATDYQKYMYILVRKERHKNKVSLFFSS